MDESTQFPNFSESFRKRYQLLEVLGEGGVGTVYRARQIDLDRDVAIKVLKKLEPTQMARLVREARILAALSCPAIMAVYDAGEDSGLPYIVCELLSGETLEDWQARRTPTLREALVQIRRVALALAAAHDAGVVHRDVKPANIYMPDVGGVKLTDFGLARQDGDGSALTATGVVLGTPAYMAPEQFTGSAVGPAADQYSLGVIAFELITGTVPVRAETLSELVSARLERDIESLRSIHSDLPAAADELVRRALARQPEDRYADLTAFAAAITSLLDRLGPLADRRYDRAAERGPTVTLVRPERPVSTRVPRGTRRSKVVRRRSPLGLYVALCVAGGLGLAAWGWHAIMTPARVPKYAVSPVLEVDALGPTLALSLPETSSVRVYIRLGAQSQQLEQIERGADRAVYRLPPEFPGSLLVLTRSDGSLLQEPTPLPTQTILEERADAAVDQIEVARPLRSNPRDLLEQGQLASRRRELATNARSLGIGLQYLVARARSNRDQWNDLYQVVAKLRVMDGLERLTEEPKASGTPPATLAPANAASLLGYGVSVADLDGYEVQQVERLSVDREAATTAAFGAAPDAKSGGDAIFLVAVEPLGSAQLAWLTVSQTSERPVRLLLAPSARIRMRSTHGFGTYLHRTPPIRGKTSIQLKVERPMRAFKPRNELQGSAVAILRRVDSSRPDRPRRPAAMKFLQQLVGIWRLAAEGSAPASFTVETVNERGILLGRIYIRDGYRPFIGELDGNRLVLLVDSDYRDLGQVEVWSGELTQASQVLTFKGRRRGPACGDQPVVAAPAEVSREPLRLEGEEAHLTGGLNSTVMETVHAGFSGHGYLGRWNEPERMARFAFRAHAGRYQLVFRYSARGPKCARNVAINGAAMVRVGFASTGSWNEWRLLESGPVELVDGHNELAIGMGSREDGPVNLDYLEVRPYDGK